MKTNRFLFLSIVFAVAIYSIASALDTDYNSSTGKSRDQSREINQREEVSRGSDAGASISLAAIVRLAMAKLEHGAVEPFATCKLLTQPPTTKSMGLLPWQKFGGAIDSTFADWARGQIDAGATVTAIAGQGADSKVREVVECAFGYGQIGGAAIRLLASSGPRDDFDRDGLAVVAVDIISHIAKNMGKGGGMAPCRFAGEVGRIVCGRDELEVGKSVHLAIAGVEWLGHDKLGGYQGDIKLHSAKNFSRGKSRSIGERFSKELRESFSLNPGKFLPQVGAN